tara:strand:+ start:14240 stop:15268 length:1029 start_codon:yes stop_codon:yes gene_type:complete
MAKKQKEEERVFDGGEMGAVDVVGQKTRNGYEFIKNMNTEEVGAPNYIFGHVQAVVNPWVRKKRAEFDVFTEAMETLDKGSDEHMVANKGRESIANSFSTLRKQLDKYNMGSLKLKESLGAMSLGTDDSSLFVNMLVYGGQSDGVNIDDGGKLSFGRVRSSGDSAYRQDEEDNIDVFHLDNVNDPVEGASPIIIEPYESKAYVWNLAEETNRKKEQGEEFDEEWVSKRIAYELTNKGDKNTIGLAFADLAGDNSSKSFADQWRDGLSDSYFYTNPETGQPITNKDNSWMKDPANYAILQKYLGRYITNIMRDVHGPTINKETGQVKRTQAQIAQDIVKKYSK